MGVSSLFSDGHQLIGSTSTIQIYSLIITNVERMFSHTLFDKATFSVFFCARFYCQCMQMPCAPKYMINYTMFLYKDDGGLLLLVALLQ